MFFSKFFKKKYPYAPIAYLGRKTVERTLDANIRKLKKVEKEIDEEQLDNHDHSEAETSKSGKKNAESKKALNEKLDASKNSKKNSKKSVEKSVEKGKKKASKKSKS